VGAGISSRVEKVERTRVGSDLYMLGRDLRSDNYGNLERLLLKIKGMLTEEITPEERSTLADEIDKAIAKGSYPRLS
jgi:hypothetical protein